MNQLLTHVVSKLTDQTENAAVYALGYILSRSGAAKLALRDHLNLCVPDIGKLTDVTAQRTGEAGDRPDLVVFGPHHEERVLIEAKFGADLTPNQPGAYLERLPIDATPSVLAVVAPAQRLESLWIELLRRIYGDAPRPDAIEHEDIKCIAVDGGNRYLQLTSWRMLLDRMLARSMDAEDGLECDIRQLQALCEQQDLTAFLPIQPGEFSPAFPLRILHLNGLISDAVAQATEIGIVNVEGLNVTPQSYGNGRYLKLGGEGEHGDQWAGAWLGVNIRLWSTFQETPIWLMFSQWDGVLPVDDLHGILQEYNWAEGTDSIPVHLSTGVDRHQVLVDFVEFLTQIANQIANHVPAPE